jgi:hypothetical protein
MILPQDTLLTTPQEVIGRQWSDDHSPPRARLLGLARDALLFVSATGQEHRFEDFREGLVSGSTLPAGVEGLEERMKSTEDLFTRLRDESDSAEEKKQIQVILDVLLFISATGQHALFSEYLAHVEAGAPPYAIAAFKTREEADEWLRNHPHPPLSANVLVGNDYLDVVYDRKTNSRRLGRNRDLEYYLAELRQEEPFRPIASFDSLDEAEAWLKAQPEPARWAWVSISGEPYLAVYHPNIGHRALYPLSMARGYDL